MNSDRARVFCWRFGARSPRRAGFHVAGATGILFRVSAVQRAYSAQVQ
jgi:hypothetical protein